MSTALKDKPNDIYVTAPRQVLLTPGTCPPLPHSQGSRRASKRLFKSVYGTVAQGVIHKRLQYMWAFRCPCNVFGWSRGLGQRLVCAVWDQEEVRLRSASARAVYGPGMSQQSLDTCLLGGDYRDSWAKANTANAVKGQQQGERQARVYALVDVIVRWSMTAGHKWMYMWSPNKGWHIHAFSN